MDHHCVFRCWRYSFLALILFFSFHVKAAITPIVGPNELSVAATITGIVNNCNANWTGNSSRLPCWSTRSEAPPNTVLKSLDKLGNVYQTATVVYISNCPTNSTISGSSCTCNSGYLEQNGVCVSQSGLDDDVCTNAARLSLLAPKSDYDLPGSVGDQTLCLPSSGLSAGKGCNSAFQVSAKYSKPDGTKVTNGELSPVAGTGSSCVLPVTPAAPTPNTCKDGQPGQVNGVTVCVPYPPGTTTETTSKSGTTGKDANGADKVVDQTSTTVCTGNSCNTTTTTNTTVGGSTVTTTNTQTGSKSSFCTTNPKDKQCGQDGSGGSGFSGSCKAAFTCEGDAVQCAMAKEQFTRNCQTLEKDTDDKSVVNQALTGADKLNTDEMKKAAHDAPVGVGSFDSSGRGWSRACPADPVIPLVFVNKSFTIPFSRLCGPLGLLSSAAVAITLLGSLIFVIGGSKASAAA